MAEKLNDGGPAFPTGLKAVKVGTLHGFYESAHVTEYVTAAAGASLRDLFAIQALPFCLQEFGRNADDQQQFETAAYQIADRMLAEREKERS